jgi:hypothetical protein
MRRGTSEQEEELLALWVGHHQGIDIVAADVLQCLFGFVEPRLLFLDCKCQFFFSIGLLNT